MQEENLPQALLAETEGPPVKQVLQKQDSTKLSFPATREAATELKTVAPELFFSPHPGTIPLILSNTKSIWLL